MNGGDVTAPAPESLLQRQSERGRERERGGGGKEKQRRGKGEAAGAGGPLGFAPMCSCANSSPVCQASVRGRRVKCTQLWERKEEGEKMEKSYCTRCGHRLQEFQLILEMHKKKAGSSSS